MKKPSKRELKVALHPETTACIVDGIVKGICGYLENALPVYARIAAADTIHTGERMETVFRHAIKEVAVVRAEIAKASGLSKTPKE